MAWRRRLRIEPLIVALTRRFHEIREQEMARSAGRLGALSPEQLREVESLSRRIVNNLLHEPVKRIKNAANGEQKDTLLFLAQQLFGIEEEGQ